jgi:hypothetical protein
METNAPQTTIPNASAATPLPAGGDASRPPETTPPAPDSGSAASAAAAAPMIDRLIERTTRGAHDAVDSVAAKVTSLSAGLKSGASKPADLGAEWAEAARDAVRRHPLASVAGALVVGAALLSLMSSRRD